jgi:transposase InsO family protein
VLCGVGAHAVEDGGAQGGQAIAQKQGIHHVLRDGTRWRGRAAARPIKKSVKPGYAFLHHVIDDHSRLAYSEILADERRETVVAFWARARAWFADRGITVERVLTDNGCAYRSKLFAAALGDNVMHKRTGRIGRRPTARVSACFFGRPDP